MPTTNLVELMSRLLQGHAENDRIKAVEEFGGCLRGSILRPGHSFPSKAHPQDAPNQHDLTLWIAVKLLGTPPSMFYSTGVISIEQTSQFALKAAWGKWEIYYDFACHIGPAVASVGMSTESYSGVPVRVPVHTMHTCISNIHLLAAFIPRTDS